MTTPYSFLPVPPSPYTIRVGQQYASLSDSIQSEEQSVEPDVTITLLHSHSTLLPPFIMADAPSATAFGPDAERIAYDLNLASTGSLLDLDMEVSTFPTRRGAWRAITSPLRAPFDRTGPLQPPWGPPSSSAGAWSVPSTPGDDSIALELHFETRGLALHLELDLPPSSPPKPLSSDPPISYPGSPRLLMSVDETPSPSRATATPRTSTKRRQSATLEPPPTSKRACPSPSSDIFPAPTSSPALIPSSDSTSTHVTVSRPSNPAGEPRPTQLGYIRNGQIPVGGTRIPSLQKSRPLTNTISSRRDGGGRASAGTMGIPRRLPRGSLLPKFLAVQAPPPSHTQTSSLDISELVPSIRKSQPVAAAGSSLPRPSSVLRTSTAVTNAPMHGGQENLQPAQIAVPVADPHENRAGPTGSMTCTRSLAPIPIPSAARRGIARGTSVHLGAPVSSLSGGESPAETANRWATALHTIGRAKAGVAIDLQAYTLCDLALKEMEESKEGLYWAGIPTITLRRIRALLGAVSRNSNATLGRRATALLAGMDM